MEGTGFRRADQLCPWFWSRSSRAPRPHGRPHATGRPSRRSASRTSRPGATASGGTHAFGSPAGSGCPCEHRPEAVPPVPHRLVTDVDPALEQQVLYIPQRQRETHVHQHHQPDHLGRGVEVAKKTSGLVRAGHPCAPARLPMNGCFKFEVGIALMTASVFYRASVRSRCFGNPPTCRSAQRVPVTAVLTVGSANHVER